MSALSRYSNGLGMRSSVSAPVLATSVSRNPPPPARPITSLGALGVERTREQCETHKERERKTRRGFISVVEKEGIVDTDFDTYDRASVR